MARNDYVVDRLGEISFEIDITDSTTVSDAVDLIGVVPVALLTPAALTSSSITLQGSIDNTTYYPIYNASGTQVTIQIGTTRHIGLLPQDFAGFRYFKIVAAGAEAADRTFKLVVRGM